MATEDDPNRPFGTCPRCGQSVGARQGQQTPPHRDDDRKPCSGGTAQ